MEVMSRSCRWRPSKVNSGHKQSCEHWSRVHSSEQECLLDNVEGIGT